MKIYLSFSNSTQAKISQKFVQKIIDDVFSVLGKKGEYRLGVSIVGEKKIKNLNKTYRKKDKSTDVLSFAENDVKCKYSIFFKSYDSDAKDLGEVFICWQKIKIQAKNFSRSLEEEFIFLVIHGVLHLFGYDHIQKKKAEKMQAMEQKIMMGIADQDSF